ncbi:unnamed protein product [Oncorhynchus mykiss]|uniref:Uncharacterized protein n=1 Tax=Oncorhynchus mykiss TaxID=8022 RepID=A0A060Y6F6_ONCMY|nr:unnamed protein product [Oncorhynchus mykiss]
MDLGPSYAFDTDMVNDQTTSKFRVDKITERDTGYWICQVKTTAGQAEREFMVNVKVPPMPQYPPMLNSSGPYHLVVLVNKEPYTGDGPVTSVKVIYKQVNTSVWKTVEGSVHHRHELLPVLSTTDMNLTCTVYHRHELLPVLSTTDMNSYLYCLPQT